MTTKNQCPTYQNSQEVFTKFIPGYKPQRMPNYDEVPNYDLNSCTGADLGRGLAKGFRQALSEPIEKTGSNSN